MTNLKKALIVGSVLAILMVWLFPAQSATVNYAKVTFLAGKAYKSKSEKGPWSAIRQGNVISGGYFLKTDEDTKLELTMPDGSKLRLGPNTVMHLESAKLTNSEPTRNYSARVIQGKVYARATPNKNKNSNFLVRSGSAVAGARGTAFNTILLPDGATQVKCYEGQVWVATWADYAQRYLREGPQPLPQPGEWRAPDTIPGPEVVTEEEWIRIASAMMSVTIGADGTIQDPTQFSQSDMDAWEQWNLKRDGLQ